MIEPFSQFSEVVNRMRVMSRADNKSRGRGCNEDGFDAGGRGNMSINADSSARGWEQTICQGSVQL